jgi:hypothetical protein
VYSDEFGIDSSDTGYEITIYIDLNFSYQQIAKIHSYSWKRDRSFRTVPGASSEDMPVHGVLGSKFSAVVETTLTKLRPKKPEA